MCPDLFFMENYYADVKPPTKKEQVIIEQLEQMNESAKFHNSAKANEKIITGPIKRFCPLDESPLKPIKSKPIEGLPEVSKLRYRCVLCKSVFEGYGLDLYHETKKNFKAIAFEMDSVI